MKPLLPLLALPLLSMGRVEPPAWSPPYPPPVEDGPVAFPTPEKVTVAEPTGNWVYRVRVLTTAYTPYDPIDREHGWTGRTSTGVRTAEEPWGIAVDPRAIPYGAQVRVPGYLPTKNRPAMASWGVDDTGGRLRHSWRRDGVIQLDLRFRTRSAAVRWGSRWVDVEVEVDHEHPGLAAAASEAWRMP